MYLLPETADPVSSSLARQRMQRLVFIVGLSLVSFAVPFVVYNQLSHVLDAKSQEWFIYHPFCMTMAVVAIPLPAILQRRLFGYVSNKIHMYAMITAIAFAGFGAYVIVTNKIALGEPHFQSVHAKLGLAWLVVALTLGSAGLVALDPDWSLGFFRPRAGPASFKRWTLARHAHTWSGRPAIWVGYLGVFLGWVKFFGISNLTRMIPMAVLLVAFAGIALIDPILDYSNYKKGARAGVPRSPPRPHVRGG